MVSRVKIGDRLIRHNSQHNTFWLNTCIRFGFSPNQVFTVEEVVQGTFLGTKIVRLEGCPIVFSLVKFLLVKAPES